MVLINKKELPNTSFCSSFFSKPSEEISTPLEAVALNGLLYKEITCKVLTA